MPFEIALEFEDDGFASETLAVSAAGESLLRLEVIPVFFEGAGYQDVIEVEPGSAKGACRFVRVVERSGWTTYSFCVSRGLADSPELAFRLEAFAAMGGYWERVMGGIVLIAIPPDLTYDPATLTMGLEWIADDGAQSTTSK
jgi:hypothetical protein